MVDGAECLPPNTHTTQSATNSLLVLVLVLVSVSVSVSVLVLFYNIKILVGGRRWEASPSSDKMGILVATTSSTTTKLAIAAKQQREGGERVSCIATAAKQQRDDGERVPCWPMARRGAPRVDQGQTQKGQCAGDHHHHHQSFE